MEMKQQLLELGRAGEPGWKTGGGEKQGKKIKTEEKKKAKWP